MIRVFLALELPYQRYDAITSFTCLCSRYQDFFSQGNTRELVPPMVASILEKSEQIL